MSVVTVLALRPHGDDALVNAFLTESGLKESYWRAVATGNRETLHIALRDWRVEYTAKQYRSLMERWIDDCNESRR